MHINISFWVAALFGLLPNSILEGVGDSLFTATDRYAYSVSVPRMYNIVGRGTGRSFALQKMTGSMGSPLPATSCEGYSGKKETSRKMGESEAAI